MFLEHSICTFDLLWLVSLQKHCTVQTITEWGPLFWMGDFDYGFVWEWGLVYHI